MPLRLFQRNWSGKRAGFNPPGLSRAGGLPQSRGYYIDELQALGDIPPSLQNYIDYEAYGRDLDMGVGFVEIVNNRVTLIVDTAEKPEGKDVLDIDLNGVTARYIVECLDEFISHYGTLEEVVEHKDDIYYYPDCAIKSKRSYSPGSCVSVESSCSSYSDGMG